MRRTILVAWPSLLGLACSGATNPTTETGELPPVVIGGPTGDTAAPPVTGATGDTGSGPVASLWVSEPVSVGGLHQIVGSPEGWLILGSSGAVLSAQRVAPDGALVDAAPFRISGYTNAYRGLWTGSEFAVIAVENEDYYELTAALDVSRIPASGPVALAPERVSEGLGWPRDLAGDCDGAGSCTVVLRDLHWLATGEAMRLSFGGTSSPLTPVGSEFQWPREAVRSAGRTLVSWVDLSGGPGLSWLPDDPSLPPESPVAVSGTSLAADSGDDVLVAWSHYEGDGDSGLPAGIWSVRAQRARFGEGVLDAAPIELGTGTLQDVVFTGSTFLVYLNDDGVSYFVRVGSDGVPGDRIEIGQAGRYGTLAVGAPGHLLLGSTAVDDPAFYVRVEIDVPEGGVCAEDASCLSGVCDAGTCAAGVR